MTKPLRVLILYTTLIILLVALATAQTIRTELMENSTITETGTAVYVDEHPSTYINADLQSLSGSPNNADGY